MRFLKSLNGIGFALVLIGGLMLSPAIVGRAQSTQNWAEPINLSNSGAASNPLVVVDGSGGLHVIWIDKFDGYRYTASADGVSWAAAQTVKFPFSPEDAPPVFIVNPTGPIHVFWRTKQNTLRYAQTSANSFGNPTAWGALTTLDGNVLDFDVAFDAVSGLHVAYIKNPESGDGAPGVYYRRSQTGSNWASPSLLYESQYFRSLDPSQVHVRIAASNDAIYAVWDDRSLKRIFRVESRDAGVTWGDVFEHVGPQADLGFKTPINVEITVFNENVLLMWQVGDPGIRCSQFSQWSADGGTTWLEPVRMFDEFIACPDQSDFLFADQDYVMALFSIQGDLSLVAWNGVEWSLPDTQGGLSVLSNPKTFDLIDFQCQQAVRNRSTLFVVGCDQGGTGDIWLTSRALDPADVLFPQPSDWGMSVNMLTAFQQVPSLVSEVDQENNMHVLWVQTAASATEVYEPRIQYARWHDGAWSNPSPVILDGGIPGQLTLAIDNQQRLLLSWVNQDTGDLWFSWANSSRANIPSEWFAPVVLPSPSNINSAPDILVDSSNRIVIAFAVKANEGRGIYIVQSDDLGETWSLPVQVFDAVVSDWESVDQPKIALTGDGRLHVLFTRYSVLGGGRSAGLYYSQSGDGGGVWSDPELLTEQSVLWSELMGTNERTIHALWQEQTRETTIVSHQFSQNGGDDWETAIKLSSLDVQVSQPALVMTGQGVLHLIQIVSLEKPTLQEWEWTGSAWRLVNTNELRLPAESQPVSLTAGIRSGSALSVIMLFEEEGPDAEHQSRLSNISRQLVETVDKQFIPLMKISGDISAPFTPNTVETTATPTALPLLIDQGIPQSTNKNTIGLILVGVILVVVFLFLLPGRRKKAKPS